MVGVDGVFSVQFSLLGGMVIDEQEVCYGIIIVDFVVECGVKYLVYSFGSVMGEMLIGVVYYDIKVEIEWYICCLLLVVIIVWFVIFMELLVMSGFGFDEGCF